MGEINKATTENLNIAGDLAATQVAVPPSTAKEELASLLSYIRQQTEAGVEGGKSLVIQQAPLVAKEIVAYRRAQATAMELIPVMMLLFTVQVWRLVKKAKWDGEGIAGALFVSVINLILFSCFSQDFLKTWLAPRLVILDYIRHLL